MLIQDITETARISEDLQARDALLQVLPLTLRALLRLSSLGDVSRDADDAGRAPVDVVIERLLRFEKP
ncbi:hypothetical protein D3C83_332330 [compost metagenome]